MDKDSQEKWQGKTCAKLTRCTADQIWPLLEDYCNIHKWLPIAEACDHVDGLLGQPGCIRRCSLASTTLDGSSATIINWANEKLIAIDPIERCFSYQVLENNVGFGDSYVATVKVLPGGIDNEGGCEIEWSFVTNPMESWGLEGLVNLLSSNLDVMAKRMEEALQIQTTVQNVETDTTRLG